ncbi:MAG TPA: 3'(2'),5'-bisphosphate nucleotidase CysQ [Steroidobacteraceae bacterium]|jgi:3'(2'), 5'-bisphosphate nucleotidase|nr:3'(2'),5'-bisphosphate nucleotidase CysQ [Steroidobacteraceae bacterium]
MRADPGGLLERSTMIARAAGREILEVYAAGAAAATPKADDSPLTAADLRAHRLIVEQLRKLTPELAVLSEESAQVPFTVRSQWRRYWLVDPLDGTREFLSRNGEFTVNIALIEDHSPVLGVVHVPVTDTTYYGVPGTGAWRQQGAEPEVAIRVAPHSAVPVRIVGSRSHRGDSLAAFLERVGPHALLAIGSSLKFCLVAEGAADVYPRLGPTSEWDTAAAHAVLLAAGGTLRALDGAPLAYNSREALLNPFFVAFGPDDHDWLALLR